MTRFLLAAANMVETVEFGDLACTLNPVAKGVLSECLLLALSGHSDDHVSMSGFGQKADMQIDATNVR